MKSFGGGSVASLAMSAALLGGLAVGVAFVAVRPNPAATDTVPASSAAPTSSRSGTAEPPELIIDAEGPASAAQAASRYLIEELGGSTCQGGSGSEGVYTLDPKLYDEADAAPSTDRWLRGDRVWLGKASTFIDALGAETIPGATADGDVWVLRHDDTGVPYAQHLVEHESPGGRSIWIAMSTFVSLDPEECA